MNTCLLCRKETSGSIGKSGIKWKSICQKCKDIEDEALEKRIKNQTKTMKYFNNILSASFLDKDKKE